mmetsp:Transcript_20687/g.24870  ORF Transcript_20687/g.24870 Transcript_20687/m.24870 type:complete len:138 (-) Transcript_20687:365-778(-)|eukprot:CAMPEP_0197850450 /NCGR_PEP_ID=MMETSP1438-20131217/15370_1 /TAXON_ID=1461541 /ORGANISM="Pterosperma sp., Strain CCMP1384" /LENGTH=137 /DNA_ID=CAMNT_0043463609 /DNA_START=113 /DNA_END=526 /DNA_ORIENTATION=+
MPIDDVDVIEASVAAELEDIESQEEKSKQEELEAAQARAAQADSTADEDVAEEIGEEIEVRDKPKIRGKPGIAKAQKKNSPMREATVVDDSGDIEEEDIEQEAEDETPVSKGLVKPIEQTGFELPALPDDSLDQFMK